MAGKHVGGDRLGGAGRSNPVHHFHPKVDKAYAEGRQDDPIPSEPVGSPVRLAWSLGNANLANAAFQYETAVV